MRPHRGIAAILAAAVVGAVLTACSAVDWVVWGPEGSRVINATEQLIHAAATGDAEPLACDGSAAEYGEQSEWAGLSAGEPERIHNFWAEQAELGATWVINLETIGRDVSSGERLPGYVFYSENNADLCVVDIGWETVG